MVHCSAKFIFINFCVFYISVLQRASGQSAFDSTDQNTGDDINSVSDGLKVSPESNSQENSIDTIPSPAEGETTDPPATPSPPILLADERDPSDWFGRCPSPKRWACCGWDEQHFVCEWLRPRHSGCAEILCCTPDADGFTGEQCPRDAAEKRDERRRRYLNTVPVPDPAAAVCKPRRELSVQERDEGEDLLAAEDC